MANSVRVSARKAHSASTVDLAAGQTQVLDFQDYVHLNRRIPDLELQTTRSKMSLR